VGGTRLVCRATRTAMREPSREGAGVGAQDEPLAVLTRTERLVAEQLAEGRTNAAIAQMLVLAEGTVKNHVSALLRKLGARDRTGLALTLYKTLTEQPRLSGDGAGSPPPRR